MEENKVEVNAQLVADKKGKHWHGYINWNGIFYYSGKYRETREEALADAGRMLDELKGRI